MSTDLQTTDKEHSQISVSASAESTRSQTEIQARVMIAQRFPRNTNRCIERIKASCERFRLAKNACYLFKRGGEDITGPSISLMESIAQVWGNIDFGFRELQNAGGQSLLECYAWDMESNVRYSRQIVVKHAMKARGQIKNLTDPIDVRYHIANQAQRSVRTALENTIPRDVIDEAIEQCEATIKANVKFDAADLKSLGAAFKEYGVSVEMIEKRIQRPIAQIQAAQYLKLRKIYMSLREGISRVENWFDLDKKPEMEHGESVLPEGDTVKTGTAKPKRRHKKEEPEPEKKETDATPEEEPSLDDLFETEVPE